MRRISRKSWKRKTIKVSILEGDTENMEGWYIGEIKPEVVQELMNRPEAEKPKPFAKLSKGNGVEYSYICFKKEV